MSPNTTNAHITITSTAEVEIPSATDVTARSGGRFALVVYCAGDTEVVPLLADVPLVVGRGFPSQVQLAEERASRQHARFLLQSGAVGVEDLASRNGTYVNSERIATRVLAPGDEIRIGSSTIVLVATRARPEDPGGVLRDTVVIENPRVEEAYALARRAARTDAPVLVLGETGTGKEHLASFVHASSARASGPLKILNCGALPETLIESVLFGHEKGAFTGADRRTAGIFEDASGGVLFLDEVAELSRKAQAALLRALEAKKVCRVGSSNEIAVDVRIVAATHCDLARMVEDKTFRQDLFYRLNTVTLELPPLRERLDELPRLVELFLNQAREEWNVPVVGVTPDVMEALRRYDWPGNIRQLRNVLERAALAADSPQVGRRDLPRAIAESREPQSLPAGPAGSAGPTTEASLAERLEGYEAELVTAALRRTGGNRPAAAKMLKIPLRSLYRRIRALGLTDGDERA